MTANEMPPRKMRALLLIVGFVVLWGCSNTDHADTVNRDTGVYVAVITAAVNEQTSPGKSFDRPAYIAGTATNRIGLAVQAAVVAQLSQITTRFVDSRDEAIDANAAGDPVRDDGLLLTLGKINPLADSKVTVQVESYHGAGTDVSKVDIVQLQGNRWVVIGRSPAGP